MKEENKINIFKWICKYYKKIYTYEYLNEQFIISPYSESLLIMSDVGEAFGLRTIIERINFEDFKKLNFDKPIVIEIDNRLIGVLKKGKSVTLFENSTETNTKWDSLQFKDEKIRILTLEATPQFFSKTNKNKEGLGFLMSYILPYKKYLFQLSLGVLIITLLQVIAPFLTQMLIDNGVNGKDLNLVHVILIALIVLQLSKVISEFIRNWIYLHISSRINLSLVSDFLIKLFKLPVGFFNSRSIGDIMQRIDDQRRVENFLTVSMINILFSGLTFVVFSFILYFYDSTIALVFLSASFLYIIWNIFFMNVRKKLDINIFRLTSTNKNLLVQILQNMQDIKLENIEKQERWQWERTQVSLFEQKKKNLYYEQINTLGSVFINELKNILILYYSAISVINGEITLGAMVAIQYIIGQTNKPISDFSKFIIDYQMAIISIRRITAIHDENNEHEKINEVITSIPEENKILFNDVSYRYSEKGKNTFGMDKLNFEIPEKKVTAIIGSSGSGKTSILKLILKLQNPNSGKILIGGINLKNVNTRWWRSNCGVIFQDSNLFNKSILRNIVGDTVNIDMDRLVYAINTTNISQYIDNLPNGLKTIVNGNGKGLSAGQKQRILLARLVYKNPKFVFLDEATSSLDVTNEYEILRNLKDFFLDKTVIIITHKLNRVINADKIILINNGKIIQQGTHDELINSENSTYNKMLELSSI
ncbi:peptidase domain-containing ABC transporter [Flavobacterium sp.]|uniref:peptidase domain-containing ABC transporter n=1 Tax=Flavobacterium sp. TaxID=239 RepID=UPI00262B4C29|nr:peptidase domain-containing ABC transporter [Flavobacterium sp.]MDD2984760.1 peptidase domain-containing ABC transporter [Flavobacterium sp.]